MSVAEWLTTVAGVAIVGAVVTDVFITVLHIDREGPIAATLFQGIWRLTATGARIGKTALRRSVVAIAGPVMLVAVYAAWIALFIVGFALIYWPHLEHFRAEDALLPLGFGDALSVSGVTATVMGYGDITPA